MLYRVTKPQEREALIQLSKMLDRLLLEERSFWRELRGPSPEGELSAAAADLVHLAGFLRLLSVEHGFDPTDEVDRPKLRLCRMAGRQAVQLLRIADAIGAALPPQETGARSVGAHRPFLTRPPAGSSYGWIGNGGYAGT